MAYIKNYYFAYWEAFDEAELVQYMIDDKDAIFNSLNKILLFEEGLGDALFDASAKMAVQTLISNIELNDRVKDSKHSIEYNTIDGEIRGIRLSITIDFGTKELYEEYLFESKVK